MSSRSRPPSESWPEHVRHDPAMLAWRQDDLELRVTSLEQRPVLPSLDRLPWLQIALLATAVLGGLSGLLSPEIVLALAKGAAGLP
jgi:hypothetical protein